MSDADVKALGRLVRKYGRKAVVEAAKRVPTRGRGRGRPSTLKIDDDDDYSIAFYVDMGAAEYAEAGHAAPVRAAMADLYVELFGEEEDRDTYPASSRFRVGTDRRPPTLEEFIRMVKKPLERGRAHIRHAKETARAFHVEAAPPRKHSRHGD